MSQVKGLVKILQIKIANITSQKDYLDDYIHKMISKARETLETEEQDMNTLKEMSLTMDTVLGYLVDVITQMEDVPSTTLAEATDQSVTQASVSSSFSSPLHQHSSATLPTKSHDESLEISKLHHRMEVLEMAFTTCRNEISQVSTDKNEVRDKLDKLENHIQKVETSHSQNMATIKEQASKLGKAEKKLKKMKEEEQEIWSQIDSIHKDVESLKDDQRDNQQLVKIQSLEKQMETLTSQCDSLQDQVGKIEPVIQMSQELAHKISTLATDEQVQELIQTTTATSRSLEELTSRVEDTERSVRGCVAQRERDENRRREMEDRVAVLEARRQEDLEHYTKELEETNSLYKAVCQLVDQRVTPLRRLQRMLNDYHKQVEKREEISTRLDDVAKEVQEISTHLNRNGRTLLPSKIGFTAYCPPESDSVPNARSPITHFTDVYFNEGHNYNPVTGEFVAPVEGVYVVSITIKQWGDGEIGLHVNHLSGNTNTTSKVVCRASTNIDKTSCNGLAVVRLKSGDRVFVDVGYRSRSPKLSNFSSFSCFHIG